MKFNGEYRQLSLTINSQKPQKSRDNIEYLHVNILLSYIKNRILTFVRDNLITSPPSLPKYTSSYMIIYLKLTMISAR